MKEINLIGKNGFIGRAIERATNGAVIKGWSHSNKDGKNFFDLYNRDTWKELMKARPKTIILLSWPGLPNYDEDFHLKKNLPVMKQLICELIDNGINRIVTTGTCYEYGDHEGGLKETMKTRPKNNYAVAKDKLRKFIERVCEEKGVDWVWLRLFYIYGQGQNERALLPSLEAAIKANEDIFHMTNGAQERDFLHVDEIAKMIIEASTNKFPRGIYNAGSGRPTSLRMMAEKKKNDLNSSIQLMYGSRKARVGEPFKAWACMKKWNSVKHML